MIEAQLEDRQPATYQQLLASLRREPSSAGGDGHAQ
jgi:hypothetical protein